MQTTLERPEPAVRHRFDVDDNYRMAEAGILSREDRVGLIEGKIVDMGTVGNAHAVTMDALSRLVALAIAAGLGLRWSNAGQHDLCTFPLRNPHTLPPQPCA